MQQLDGLDYYLYGGCLRDVYMGNIPSDIDMGTNTREQLDLITARLQKCGYHLEVITPYGYKMKYLNTTIDLSNWQTPHVGEKISYFDFTINTLALTSNSEFIFHRTTLDDIDNKRLIELITPNPSDMHGRRVKFYARGFTHQENSYGPSVVSDLVSIHVEDLEWNTKEFDLRENWV
jgi:hypothetical protein